MRRKSRIYFSKKWYYFEIKIRPSGLFFIVEEKSTFIFTLYGLSVYNKKG